jgi:hypothetical protein
MRHVVRAEVVEDDTSEDVEEAVVADDGDESQNVTPENTTGKDSEPEN